MSPFLPFHFFILYSRICFFILYRIVFGLGLRYSAKVSLGLPSLMLWPEVKERSKLSSICSVDVFFNNNDEPADTIARKGERYRWLSRDSLWITYVYTWCFSSSTSTCCAQHRDDRAPTSCLVGKTATGPHVYLERPQPDHIFSWQDRNRCNQTATGPHALVDSR